MLYIFSKPIVGTTTAPTKEVIRYTTNISGKTVQGCLFAAATACSFAAFFYSSEIIYNWSPSSSSSFHHVLVNGVV